MNPDTAPAVMAAFRGQPGGDFGPPQLIGHGNYGTGTVRLGVADDGRALATWTNFPGPGVARNELAAGATSAGEFGPARTISALSSGVGVNSDVNGAGDAVITEYGWDGSFPVSMGDASGVFGPFRSPSCPPPIGEVDFVRAEAPGQATALLTQRQYIGMKRTLVRTDAARPPGPEGACPGGERSAPPNVTVDVPDVVTPSRLKQLPVVIRSRSLGFVRAGGKVVDPKDARLGRFGDLRRRAPLSGPTRLTLKVASGKGWLRKLKKRGKGRAVVKVTFKNLHGRKRQASVTVRVRLSKHP